MWHILLWIGLAFIVAAFVTIHIVHDVSKPGNQVAAFDDFEEEPEYNSDDEMKVNIPYMRVHIEYKVHNLTLEEEVRRLKRMIRERISDLEVIEEKQTTPLNSDDDDEDADPSSEEFIEQAIKKYKDDILARNARIEKEIEKERLKQEQFERNQKILESFPLGEAYEGNLADKVYTLEELEVIRNEALKTMLSPDFPPPKLWKLERKYSQFCEMHEKLLEQFGVGEPLPAYPIDDIKKLALYCNQILSHETWRKSRHAQDFFRVKQRQDFYQPEPIQDEVDSPLQHSDLFHLENRIYRHLF